MSLYKIRLVGGVNTINGGDGLEDGELDVAITAKLGVEALTRKAAEQIAVARANELLTINDSGEGVEFEVVAEKKLVAAKKRSRS